MDPEQVRRLTDLANTLAASRDYQGAGMNPEINGLSLPENGPYLGRDIPVWGKSQAIPQVLPVDERTGGVDMATLSQWMAQKMTQGGGGMLPGAGIVGGINRASRLIPSTMTPQQFVYNLLNKKTVIGPDVLKMMEEVPDTMKRTGTVGTGVIDAWQDMTPEIWNAVELAASRAAERFMPKAAPVNPEILKIFAKYR
jgi:hypothetical protein